jgi:hypothetical protein
MYGAPSFYRIAAQRSDEATLKRLSDFTAIDDAKTVADQVGC